jgi:hypothetical protein
MIIESNINLNLYPNLFTFQITQKIFIIIYFVLDVETPGLRTFDIHVYNVEIITLCGQCEHAMHHSDHLMIRLSRENMQTLEVYRVLTCSCFFSQLSQFSHFFALTSGVKFF